jgi:hypothetical protein
MSLLIIGNCCDLNCTTMHSGESFSQLDRVFPQPQAGIQIMFPASSPSQDGTSASDDPVMSGKQIRDALLRNRPERRIPGDSSF